MFYRHNDKNPDAYLRPVFPLVNKMRRLFWMFAWSLFCRWTPTPMHPWRVFILRLFGAKIGRNNFIYPSSKIWAPWLLETQDVVTIGRHAEIYNPGGVRIEHHAIISQYAYICGATHDYNSRDFLYISREIVLKPYAWICAKAIVLPGVTCEEGSVLGAGSLTSKNLKPWTVYAGNPASPVKEREKKINEFKIIDASNGESLPTDV